MLLFTLSKLILKNLYININIKNTLKLVLTRIIFTRLRKSSMENTPNLVPRLILGLCIGNCPKFYALRVGWDVYQYIMSDNRILCEEQWNFIISGSKCYFSTISSDGSDFVVDGSVSFGVLSLCSIQYTVNSPCCYIILIAENSRTQQ